MPTYLCTIAEGQLSQSQKAAVAQAITQTHSEITGAPSYFAQVIFHEVKPGNHFIGGAPLAEKTLFVYGTIRAGRTAETKRALLIQLRNVLAGAASLPQTQIWIYITDLEARQIVEYGQLLPDPGSEDAWTAALPVEVRSLMERTSRR
jgi:phenylpyruvate tautomerase PptA (4-oxalocrotonate tautomerase family)